MYLTFYIRKYKIITEYLHKKHIYRCFGLTLAPTGVDRWFAQHDNIRSGDILQNSRQSRTTAGNCIILMHAV